MKLVTTQWTRTLYNSSYKDCLKVSAKRSLRTLPLKPISKWNRRQSVSLHPNTSLMCCTNGLKEMLPNDQTSRIFGRHKDNASKTPQTHNHSDRGSDKPPSTPPLPQNPGTINPSQWTSIGQEHLEETGEDEKEDTQEETSPEQMMFTPRGEYSSILLSYIHIHGRKIWHLQKGTASHHKSISPLETLPRMDKSPLYHLNWPC